MRLSTRGLFAITALIDLAMRDATFPVPLSDLAMRHQISLSYLEQVFAKLRQHGLVQSTRGPGGGYTLGLRGNQITVADIVTAIEDSEVESDVNLSTGDAYALTEDLWNNLHAVLMARMQAITLESLAEEQKAKGTQFAERKSRNKAISLKPESKAVQTQLMTTAPNSVFGWDGVLPARQRPR